MKTVASIETLELTVNKEELIDDKWLNLILVSKKLSDYEKSNNLGYKSIRVKFYNSKGCKKYNTEMKAGMECIDIDNPMKSNSASLILKFKRG